MNRRPGQSHRISNQHGHDNWALAPTEDSEAAFSFLVSVARSVNPFLPLSGTKKEDVLHFVLVVPIPIFRNRCRHLRHHSNTEAHFVFFVPTPSTLICFHLNYMSF